VRLLSNDFNRQYNAFIFNTRLLYNTINLSGVTVDDFDNANNYLFVNNLDYRPKPINIDFISSGSRFTLLNYSFYNEESTSPDVVFLDSLDFKLNDSLAYYQILRNYQFFDFQNNKFLLKRNSKFIDSRIVPFNSTICIFNSECSFDYDKSKALIVSSHLDSSFLGKLRSFLYKDSKLELSIKLDNGNVRSIQNVSMSEIEGGLLLNPMIENSQDISLIKKNELDFDSAVSISINIPKRYLRYFNEDYLLELKYVETSYSNPNSLLKSFDS
jgi:hypothetical protein